MDEIQIRLVCLIIGIIIGATASNAYNARKYARTAQTEIHIVLLKLQKLEQEITHEDK